VHVFERAWVSNAITAAYHLIHAWRNSRPSGTSAQARRHFGSIHPINFNPGIIKGATGPPACGLVRRRLPDRDLPGWSSRTRSRNLAVSRKPRAISVPLQQPAPWNGPAFCGRLRTKGFAAPEAAFGKAFDAVYGAPWRIWSYALTDTRFYGLNHNIQSLCFGASARDARFNEYVDWIVAQSTKRPRFHCGVVRVEA